VKDFENTNWWKYMDEPMRDLMLESFHLLGHAAQDLPEGNHDYSYAVFPAAKAYEGFLKKLFLDLKLINKRQYAGDRYRIGRSLNPHLPKRYQWDWVFVKLTQVCGGEIIPLRMWETWKLARNKIFHYFPGSQEVVSLNQARGLIDSITTSMEKSLSGCKLAS
jgi:hypothetical protein